MRADPELARYVEGFGRPGDFGVVAHDEGRPLGAAWCRLFPRDAPGYGFVDETTPELSIAVFAGQRGRGIGTALVEALKREAENRRFLRLSLSVEHDNPAAALYRRQGFQQVGSSQGASTLLLNLPQGTRPASR